MKNKVSICSAEALYNDMVFTKMLKNASSFRAEKVMSQKKREDKNLCLAATYLLDMHLLSFGLCEKQMEYYLNEYGKPMFCGHDLFFNLSHSGSFAMCAVSRTSVGCDIQKIKEGKSAAEKFLTEEERKYICAHENRDFFRIWALKESIAKAHGRGVSIMRSFSVVEDMKIKDRVFIENDVFYPKQVDSPEGYFAAVCFTNNEDCENPTILTVN